MLMMIATYSKLISEAPLYDLAGPSEEFMMIYSNSPSNSVKSLNHTCYQLTDKIQMDQTAAFEFVTYVVSIAAIITGGYFLGVVLTLANAINNTRKMI